MKFASTTLTGNAQAIIGDALRSVASWVDQCIVIDTGVTDSSLQIARQVAGDKLVVLEFAWTRDFAQARNFALDAAHRLGFDWALTVDTDERIVSNGEDIRATLAETTAGVLMMPHQNRSYVKERAVRLPSKVRYRGPTHEAFAGYQVGTVQTKRAYFIELPKGPDECRKKFERDLEMLVPYVNQHPSDPRWHYYLGDTLKNLGRFEEAVAAYAACTALRGWDEESAWACFRAAQCLQELGRYPDMIDVLALGMSRHPGLAELPWYAAFAASKLHQHQKAVHWAHLAIPWGWFLGRGASVPRIGFRYLPGLFEGPFDVLRFALRALGDEKGAAQAEQRYQEARAARLEFIG